MVTHDGAPFIGTTLGALNAQTRSPDALVGVDTGSRDASKALLTGHLPEGSLVLDDAGGSFGSAVRLAAGSSLPVPAPAGAQRWIWMIHDDSAPAPDALERLLEAIEKAPSVTVAGCKQVEAHRPDRLIDVGLTHTRAGRRFNAVSAGEVDQGQQDHRTDVLGVNSAGLLVRADVFEALGGFDPALPGIGDDVDFGRRARLAGHRVVVVPEARMLHEPDAVAAVVGPRAQERAAAYTRLKFAPGLALPFLSVWMMLVGVGRAIGRLIAKDPGSAVVDLGAGATGLLRAPSVLSGRRRLKAAQKVPRSVVKSLLASPTAVREQRRAARDAARLDTDENAGRGPAREASGGDDGFEALEAGTRSPGSTGGALIAIALSAALSLLGLYRFFGAQAAAGGALIAPGQDLHGLWVAATSGWRSLGTGAPGAPDPFAWLVWLSGVVSFGHPQQAAVALYVLAMPLAALSAWLLLGAFTRSPGFRCLGAALYALAPALQLALAQGHPGAATVHVLAPVLLLALVRAVGAARSEADGVAPGPGRGGFPSWAAACCAAVLGAAVVAAEPLLILPLVLFSVVAAFTRRGRALWWVPVPALALAAPLLVQALVDPRVLLQQPGLALGSEAAPVWQQLLGWPLGFDQSGALPIVGSLASVPLALVVALVIAAPVGALALASVLRPGPGTTSARVLLGASLAVLLLGAAAAHLDAGVSGTQVVHLYVGSFVSLFCAAALGAAAVQREALSLAPSAPRAKLGKGLAGVASALLTLSLLAAASLWVLPRVGVAQEQPAAFATAQLVEPTTGAVLPATAADRGLGRYAERTLVLTVRADGALEASLASGDGVRLEDLSAVVAAQRLEGPVFEPGTAQRAPERAGDAAVRSAVASLTSGEQLDVRDPLADLAVTSVVLRAGDAGADVVAKTLDSVPGLAAVGRSEADSSWIWRVRAADTAAEAEASFGSPTARVRVLSQDGATTRLIPSDGGNVARYDLPSGPAGRTLVLAESAHSGWVATLNGQRLSATSHGWAQAFELPQSGGVLSVKYVWPWTPWWLLGLGLVLFVCLISLVPVPRSWRADARAQAVYRPTVAQRAEQRAAAQELPQEEA